ncbi:hypothetical protein M0802_016443 [Mischocyttarus mexicanus]|nr:hypothetical protein M0802_016443 [Mischocyttarus mexicanus]
MYEEGLWRTGGEGEATNAKVGGRRCGGKCCPLGQELIVNIENGISKVSNDCKINTTDWKPTIYSPSQQKKFHKPLDNWNVLEGKRPECQEDSVLTGIAFRPSLPFLFLEDGFVIVDGNIEEQISPSDYCADTNAIMVCVKQTPEGNHVAATMKPKIKRCCGESAVFHEEKLVILLLSYYILLLFLTYLDFIFNYKYCLYNSNFANR